MLTFGDRRQMGCTRADLRRWLRELIGQDVGDFAADRIELHRWGIPVGIAVSDLPERRIGLVVFRALQVQFEYDDADGERVRAWIASFDRHTQRGGG